MIRSGIQHAVALAAFELGAIRQHEALERAVADLARFIKPTADELARLREALRDEAAKLYATSGHTFESALGRVSELLRDVIVVRPDTPWEDLREHLRRLAEPKSGPLDLPGAVAARAREDLFAWAEQHAAQPREPRPAPRVTGWQIGGIRAARRNRLRRR